MRLTKLQDKVQWLMDHVAFPLARSIISEAISLRTSRINHSQHIWFMLGLTC